MDEALIKPQRVRRVVRVQPLPRGESGAADVVARGTLVEVADPRALRPRDFRADFVYSLSDSAADVAKCDVPPLLESVLGGTDAALVVAGPEDAGQAELIDAPEGLGVAAAQWLFSQLQERQARHRSDGSGGYSFQMKLQCFQVVGDRVEDLLTDQPEPARLADAVNGAVVEGLSSVSVAAVAEAAEAIELAQRRRDLAHRGLLATALAIEVTQADYWAGWGLFGRLLILETPAMDCLAQDRGLVQLRDGFDTFRGVYHLRNLVKAGQQRTTSDAMMTPLTWLLRDVLCGGSVSATFIFCLRQRQANVSSAILEFMDDLGKVETNPVCCDHRVAGLTRAMRIDSLQARQALLASRKGVGIDQEGIEDARRIILELERRLRAAERARDEATRVQETKTGQAVDISDKYSSVIHSQEQMHEQLVVSEEDRLQACEGLVEMHMKNTELMDEMSEQKYKDSMLLVVLETEVAELQATARTRAQDEDEARALAVLKEDEAEARAAVDRAVEDERLSSELEQARRDAEEMRLSLDGATEARISLEVAYEVERTQLQNRIDKMQVEMDRGALGAQREAMEAEVEAKAMQREAAGSVGRAEDVERQLASELRMAQSACSGMEEQVELAREAERRAEENADASAEAASKAQLNFEQRWEELAASAGTASGEAALLAQLTETTRAHAAREQQLLEDLKRMQARARELQDQLVWASHTALAWAPPHGADAEKARLRSALQGLDSKVDAALDGMRRREEGLESDVNTLRTELEQERQQHRLADASRAAELEREVSRRNMEDASRAAELMALKQQIGSQPEARPIAGIQQHLIGEVETLKREAALREKELLERKRALEARLEQLEGKTPAKDRAQLQRLDFLERSLRSMEAERSELLVRSTVAEEQLSELQRHLREMTQGYQMQIVELKLQAQRAAPLPRLP